MSVSMVHLTSPVSIGGKLHQRNTDVQVSPRIAEAIISRRAGYIIEDEPPAGVNEPPAEPKQRKTVDKKTGGDSNNGLSNIPSGGENYPLDPI